MRLSSFSGVNRRATWSGEYATATNTEKLVSCEVTGSWAIEQANGDVDPESGHNSGCGAEATMQGRESPQPALQTTER
jgi:hypothetical protein